MALSWSRVVHTTPHPGLHGLRMLMMYQSINSTNICSVVQMFSCSSVRVHTCCMIWLKAQGSRLKT